VQVTLWVKFWEPLDRRNGLLKSADLNRCSPPLYASQHEKGDRKSQGHREDGPFELTRAPSGSTPKASSIHSVHTAVRARSVMFTTARINSIQKRILTCRITVLSSSPALALGAREACHSAVKATLHDTESTSAPPVPSPSR